MNSRIITGDCAKILPTLASNEARLIVTSPPYPGQYGNTMDPEQWLAWMSGIVGGMRHALMGNGVLVFNVMFKRAGGWFDTRVLTAVPALLQQHGFNMLDVYQYVKPNPAPNGPLQFCDVPAWEPVFVATPAASPFDVLFNPQRRQYRPKSLASDGSIYSRGKAGVIPSTEGARQTNVLTLSGTGDQGRPKAQGVSFPLDLPLRFIQQYTNPGDLVIDPFSGAGTTAKAADMLGRSYIGIEINEAEAEKSRAWLIRKGWPSGKRPKIDKKSIAVRRIEQWLNPP